MKDEFTEQPGVLEHAIALRAMYGRQRCHDPRAADYAQPESNYASIPFVVTAGDPLQFPPVPGSTVPLTISRYASPAIAWMMIGVLPPRRCKRRIVASLNAGLALARR